MTHPRREASNPITADYERAEWIASTPPAPTGGPFALRRCPVTYPGAATLRGRAIRCESAIGHDGPHGHSFAARYWS